jgi:hypothetical protein
MFFFSIDGSEVQQVGRELVREGIPCKIRSGLAVSPTVRETELWVENDSDCHRAFMICVQRGIGFARRATEPVDADW